MREKRPLGPEGESAGGRENGPFHLWAGAKTGWPGPGRRGGSGRSVVFGYRGPRPGFRRPLASGIPRCGSEAPVTRGGGTGHAFHWEKRAFASAGGIRIGAVDCIRYLVTEYTRIAVNLAGRIKTNEPEGSRRDAEFRKRTDPGRFSLRLCASARFPGWKFTSTPLPHPPSPSLRRACPPSRGLRWTRKRRPSFDGRLGRESADSESTS